VYLERPSGEMTGSIVLVARPSSFLRARGPSEPSIKTAEGVEACQGSSRLWDTGRQMR
jgi:hypothetical protein